MWLCWAVRTYVNYNNTNISWKLQPIENTTQHSSITEWNNAQFETIEIHSSQMHRMEDKAIILTDKDFNAAAVCGRRRHRMTGIGSRQERSDLVNASESKQQVRSAEFLLYTLSSRGRCLLCDNHYVDYSSSRPPQSDLQSDNKDVCLPILPSRRADYITR